MQKSFLIGYFSCNSLLSTLFCYSNHGSPLFSNEIIYSRIFSEKIEKRRDFFAEEVTSEETLIIRLRKEYPALQSLKRVYCTKD